MTPSDERVAELRAGLGALSPEERSRMRAVLADVDPDNFRARQGWQSLRARWFGWARTHVKILIGAGVAGFAAGWMFNIFVMGSKYDGYRVPSGTPVSGEGNVVRGTLFYFLVSMIASAVVAYRLSVGKERFWADVRDLPHSMRRAMSEDGDDTAVHLLTGFAGSMVIVVAVGQSLSAALAVGVLLLFGRVLRPAVTSALMWLWRKVVSRFASGHQRPPAAVGMLVGLVGSAGAFALGWVVPDRGFQVLAGVGAGIAAFVLTRRRAAGPGATAACVLAGAALAAVAGQAAPAFADDGGFRECGNPGLFSYIFDCGGSFDVLFFALFGGTASGAGTLIGAGLGGSADDGDRKRWDELTDREKAARVLAYLRDKYPNADAAELRSYYDQLVGETDGPTFWEALDEENRQDAERARKLKDKIVQGVSNEASFLMSKEFLQAFSDELYDDYWSGKMTDRIGKTLLATGVGVKNAAGELVALPGTLFEAGGQLYEHREELMAAGMDWMRDADVNDIAALLEAGGQKVTDAAIAGVKSKLAEFEKAALAGDDDAMAKLIGDMAGSAAFDAMLGAGIGKAIEKSGLGDLLKKTDVDAPRKPGVDTDVPTRKPLDFERPLDDRYTTPYTKAELNDLMKDVKPGQKIKLTPEEAEKWSAIEKERLLDMQDNSLRYGRGTDAAEKPWAELKKGNPDALELRRDGYTDKYGERQEYQPKPNFIENKSMKDWESKYGAPKDARAGEVVAYNPDPMPTKGTVPDDVYERLVQRQKEWERVEGGKNHTSGVMYDAQGRAVQGEARVGDDGRWYTKSQITDANGVRPGDPGYTDTWSDWKRTGGDTDTFMMGGRGMVTDMDVDAHLRRTGMSEDAIRQLSAGDRAQLRDQLDEAVGEAMAYKAGAGTIPGEGRTPVWDTSDPTYDPLKHFTTLKKTQAEGVLLVDADGMHLARPGEKYDLGLSVLEQKLRATNPGDWTAKELAQLKEYGITPVGSDAWSPNLAGPGAIYGAANPSTGDE